MLGLDLLGAGGAARGGVFAQSSIVPARGAKPPPQGFRGRRTPPPAPPPPPVAAPPPPIAPAVPVVPVAPTTPTATPPGDPVYSSTPYDAETGNEELEELLDSDNAAYDDEEDEQEPEEEESEEQVATQNQGMLGLDLLGADGDSYERSAWKDGRAYYHSSPNAPGKLSADGKTFLVDVPGWHFFSSYDDWFRYGYSDAKAGKTNEVMGAPLIIVGADANVERAQVALKAAGFVGKDKKPLGIDGLMGPNTEAAITAFWLSKGASHAPVVDKDLLDALSITITPVQAISLPPQPQKASGAVPNAAASETPAVDEDVAAKRKRMLIIGGGVAAAVAGVALFVFGKKKAS